MKISVIDVLARATGKRYSTFDVVGAGPRIVAGIAEKYGEVSLYPYEKALSRLQDILHSDLVLVSAMSSDYSALSRFVNLVKQRGFKGRIVIGGPISFDYNRLLDNLPVDYVIVGEAEIPLNKLLQYINNDFDTNEIPALAYRDPSGVVKLTSRHVYTPKELLSQIKPWTRIEEAFEYPQIYRFYVEVVRGCSNFNRPLLKALNCINCLKCRSRRLIDRLECPVNIPPGCGFCSVPYMFGAPRSRSIKSIVEEVEELISHGARRIVLSAPDFLDYSREDLVNGPLTDPCYPPPNIDAIIGLLNEIYSLNILTKKKAVVMIENIKACLVTEEVGKVLGSYLKNTTIHIGLETCTDWFNDRVLGKPITFEQVIKACKILSENGIRPYIYLMYGSPTATREIYAEMLSKLDQLWKAKVEKITFYKFINLPATGFENLKENIRDYRDIIGKLKKTIDKYNLVSKRTLLGSRIEVFLVEEENKTYGYPVYHGPVVFVNKGRYTRSVNGRRGIVKIVDINSRFVKGVLVKILEY